MGHPLLLLLIMMEKYPFDLNTATKTKIDDSATAVARNISLGADSGTASSQSLKDGDVAFNVKGATGDYVSTNMNGNTVEISTKACYYQ